VREQGHEVRLMAAQYVKPYVQTNKSDFLDAEAIAEAVQRPRMRLVPIKTEEQLDLQTPHRIWPSGISGLIASTLLASRMSKQDLGTGPLEQQSCRLFL
jgi:transposase